MATDAAVNIIQRVSAEVGIPVAVAPFSSTDPNQALLVRLLNSAGTELVHAYEWPELDQLLEVDFADSGGAGSFYVPDDWGYIHNQTIWNETTRRPVMGPLSSREWYAAQLSLVSSIGMVFRQAGPALQFLPDPSPTTTIITLEYTSSYWVEQVDGTRKAAASASDDTVLIDGHVISRLLKMRWLESKGMATGAASQEFKDAFGDVTGHMVGGAILNIGGGGRPSFLGHANLPDTGYGS
jgi:hypothetical protein